MSKLLTLGGLSLIALAASATLALAQTTAAPSSGTSCAKDCDAKTADAPKKKSIFPGLKLERWDDAPDTAPAKPKPAAPSKAVAAVEPAKAKPAAAVAAEPKKGGVFAGLKLQPWKSNPEAKPAPAQTASAEPKKTGLFSGFKLEPWHETPAAEPAKTTVASTDAKKSSLFSGFRLQPWHEDESEQAKADAALKPAVDEEGHTVTFPGFKLEPWH